MLDTSRRKYLAITKATTPKATINRQIIFKTRYTTAIAFSCYFFWITNSWFLYSIATFRKHLSYLAMSVLVTLKPYKTIYVFQWFGHGKKWRVVGGHAPKLACGKDQCLEKSRARRPNFRSVEAPAISRQVASPQSHPLFCRLSLL